MSLKFPTSRGFLRIRFAVFDVFWAAAAPLLALHFRDAYILTTKGADIVLLYCTLSLICSMIAFAMFRVSEGISQYFSTQDALNVTKACVVAGLMSSVALFMFNRLDGIPRSTPVLQVIILAAGLVSARTMMLLLADEGRVWPSSAKNSSVEHIIMIGATRLSSLYIRFLRSYCPETCKIVAVLDLANRFVGRSINGVPVVSLAEHLEPVIDEFAVHGIRTDRVIIGGDEDLLEPELLGYVRSICKQHEILLDFVPKLVGLQALQVAPSDSAPRSEALEPPPAAAPVYFAVKRYFDFFAALAAIIVLSPVFLLASMIVFFDVGSPVLFWQQRIGRDRRSFMLHKFRTLRPPFDWHGDRIPGVLRLSNIGIALRKTHIDELPQLFNVLVGDMSLIGPRPLLPDDQPSNSSYRLSVRPGITGWAQINGGTLVTVEEKAALDEWYIRHISPWLDLRIAFLTFRSLFVSETRSEKAIREAQSLRYADYSKLPATPDNKPAPAVQRIESRSKIESRRH